MEATWAVDHQYLIRVSPDRVLRAVTDPKLLTAWLADRAEIEPKKGGRYLLGWTNGPTHTGEVIGFTPGREISLGWSWEGVALQGTVFSMSVEPAKGGTLFRIAHRGFPRALEWAELYGGAEWGWTYFGVNLKSVMETGHDLRSSRDG